MLPFPYFITNERDKILSVNQVLQESIVLDVINCNINDIFTDWEEVRNGKLIKAKLDGENQLFFPIKMENDHTLFVGNIFNEVNLILEEVEELHKVNRHLDAIIENSYDGIYITDKDGITLKTNSAIERITGIPKEYYINKNVNDLVTRGILKSSVTREVLEKKKSVSLLQLNFHGHEMLLTGNPVFDKSGEVEIVVTNIRDLSDLTELQKAVLKANKLNESYIKEIERLKEVSVALDDDTIVKSKGMQLIYETANRIVNVDATVLILGETGVGKDVLAKYIYTNSERSKTGNFIKVNCGAIPPDLLESELFGYAGGAFTGANKQGKPGMFELADKGVLFLDEIGEMPLNLQVKLLRVIQEQEIQRVGGTTSTKIDVRILAATNRNLKEMVDERKFREDLFYRLNVVPISIPPLRERKGEILPLSYMYLEKMNAKYRTKKKLSEELKTFIYRNEWIGNVRELFNFLERMVLLYDENMLGIEHLPMEYQIESVNFTPEFTKQMSLKEAVELAEKQILEIAAKKYETTYDIAKMLDTSQPTIVRRLKKYNIQITD
jgi:PAS domain S-box-containing protein